MTYITAKPPKSKPPGRRLGSNRAALSHYNCFVFIDFCSRPNTAFPRAAENTTKSYAYAARNKLRPTDVCRLSAARLSDPCEPTSLHAR